MFKNIALIFWYLTVAVILIIFNGQVVKFVDSQTLVINGINIWKYIFYACIMAPLVEEALYRWFPLKLAKKISPSLIHPTMIFTSIVFGLAHGFGTKSVLLQGVVGYFFAMIYIRSGWKYLASVTAHAIYNLACLGYMISL